MSADELLKFSPEQTVFFFPVGALEDHGPHLPLGLDLEEARRLCFAASERLENERPGWSGVVMPAVPLSVDSNTTALAFTVRAHVLRDWLVDVCRGLKRSGFRHFVCFSGHLGPKQLTTIEEAGKMILWGLPGFCKARLVSASSALILPSHQRSSLLWPDPSEHGGARDTSVALVVAPKDVSAEWPGLPARARASSLFARSRARFHRQMKGYWGEPARASQVQGETVLKRQLDEVFPKLVAVWDGKSPKSLFRSWYSIIPPNKSFFKSWLLFFAILVLCVAWLYIAYSDI